MDLHPLPPELEPHQHEHGLASGDPDSLAEAINLAWELFEAVVADVDLDAPSRKQGWTGRELVAKVGEWQFGRRLDDMLRDAHDGEAGFYDSDEIDEQVREWTAELPDEAILEAVSAARATTAEFLASDKPATWGLVPTSSPLGPLPLLTVVNAMTYQLSITTLDLEPCGAEVPEELMRVGLGALIDTTGALAARKRIVGSFTAVTPELIIGSAAREAFWRTEELAEDPESGPGVVAEVRTIIDVTSGRANVAHLYRTGELHVRDLGGLLRLAPVLEGIPGIPPLGAVGQAMRVVDAFGGLLGRFRR